MNTRPFDLTNSMPYELFQMYIFQLFVRGFFIFVIGAGGWDGGLCILFIHIFWCIHWLSPNIDKNDMHQRLRLKYSRVFVMYQYICLSCIISSGRRTLIPRYTFLDLI